RDTRLLYLFEQPPPGPHSPTSVDAYHHVARLDNGGRLLADFELELLGGSLGDRRHDDHTTAEVDLDVRGRHAVLHIDDLALELIARTHSHDAGSSAVGPIPNGKRGLSAEYPVRARLKSQ